MKYDLSEEQIIRKQMASVHFCEALSFAAKKHAGQIRKNGSPYILHPVAVATIVMEQGYNLRYQIVALFHDLLEDTDTTAQELKAFCNDEMIQAIQYLTKEEGFLHKDYIKRILSSPMAKAVKNADRIHNLTELSLSTDTTAMARYITDTEMHYARRFSPELDEALERLIYAYNSRKSGAG